MNDTTQKYDFSDKVGSVTINGVPFQLCDHLQKIDGKYFATAFTNEDKDNGQDETTGIYYKKISNAKLAFIPAGLIEEAAPVYDDSNQTSDLKARLIKAMTNMNNMEFREVG